MAVLSEWLQIMLAEIARKRDDVERAREEDVKRITEQSALSGDAAPSTKATGTAQR